MVDGLEYSIGKPSMVVFLRGVNPRNRNPTDQSSESEGTMASVATSATSANIQQGRSMLCDKTNTSAGTGERHRNNSSENSPEHDGQIARSQDELGKSNFGNGERHTNNSGRNSPEHGQIARSQDELGKSNFDSIDLHSDIWMRNDTGELISLLCTSEEALEKAKKILDGKLKQISLLPEEIIAEFGGTLEFKLTPGDCANLTFDPRQKKIAVTRENFRKKWHKSHFQLHRSPGQSPHGNQCKVLFKAVSLSSLGEIKDTHSETLNFQWPVENGMTSGHGAMVGPASGFQYCNIGSITARGDVFISGQGHRIDHSKRYQASCETNQRVENHSQEHLACLVSEVEQTIGKRSVKVLTIGPDGGFLELEDYSITVKPGSVSESVEDVELSLTQKADSLPKSAVPITKTFSKSIKFGKPITVTLISCLAPMPGKTFTVNIMISTGGGIWKKIQQITIRDGNVIEWKTGLSCSYIAVISEEDEKNGEYHLFCDAWVHRATGKIFFLFFKYESSLEKAREVLEVEHTRILLLPEEVIIGFGSTIKMKVESMNHPYLKMVSDDGSGGQLVIDHTMRDTNVVGLVFRPSPPLQYDMEGARYSFFCHADVHDPDGNPVDGGFEAPIHFIWPQSAVKEPVKMDARLAILTKTGEVVAVCYSQDCNEAKHSLATLSQNGFEEINSVPIPICRRAANSLQFSMLHSSPAENAVEIYPPVQVLELQHLKPGHPCQLLFKCSSASSKTACVQLIIKEGESLIIREDLEVTCKEEERKVPMDASEAPKLFTEPTGETGISSDCGKSGDRDHVVVQARPTVISYKMPLSAKERAKKYPEERNQDRRRWEEALEEKDRERKRQKKSEMTSEQKEAYQERNRLNVKRHRAERQKSKRVIDGRIDFETEMWSSLDQATTHEKVDTLIKDSNFGEAITLLETQPVTEIQQMKLLECYIEVGEDTKIPEVIENVTKLMTQNPHRKADDVCDFGVKYGRNGSYVKAITSYACAGKMYLLESDADEITSKISYCADCCSYDIFPMIEQNERMRDLALSVGMKIMNEFFDDVMSVENADPNEKVKDAAQCLESTALCYEKLENYDKAKECYERGFDIMIKHFGPNSSKYVVFGELLEGTGNVLRTSGNDSAAESFYRRAIAAYNQAVWLDDNERESFIENVGKKLIEIDAKHREE